MGRIIIFLIIIFIAYVIWQYFELKKFKITTYTLSVAGDDDYRNLALIGNFVVLADLHNQVYGKANEPLLEAIDKINPDFVVVAGDMLIGEPNANMDPAIDFMKKLAARHKVYYGNGNHEYRLRIYPDKYGDMYDRYMDALKDTGIRFLLNDSVELNLKGNTISITGLELDRMYYKRLGKVIMPQDYMSRELGDRKRGYNILIAHNPEYFEQYAKWGADLTLAGHYHGGIVRLPRIGGVISPKLRLFPKYSGGIYKKGTARMIVSCGLGMHSFPIRIWNRAELVVVNLAGKKS